MSKRLPDIQVLIPYKQLVSLLEAAEELQDLRIENAWMKEQILALRLIQSECIEKLGELKDLL